MAKTKVGSREIGDGEVKRQDLQVANPGESVIAKAVAGEGVDLQSSGADPGTGDVTITAKPSKLWTPNQASEIVKVSSAGRVGIGGDADGSAQLHLKNSDGSDLLLDSAGTVNDPQVVIRKSRGTQSAKTQLLNGDLIGAYEFQSYDGSNYGKSAAIEARMKQDAVTGGYGAELRIQTTPVFTDDPITRLLIQENGDTNFNNNRAVSLSNPINEQDAATKNYADIYRKSLGWVQFSSTNSQSMSFNARTKILLSPGFSTLNTNGPAGSNNWYNTTTEKITPDFSGDSYIFRFSADFTANQSDKEFLIELDIGGSQGVIWSTNVRTPKSGGQTRRYAFTVGIYSLGTFVANGGEVYVTYNTSGTVANPQIYLNKVFRAL